MFPSVFGFSSARRTSRTVTFQLSSFSRSCQILSRCSTKVWTGPAAAASAPEPAPAGYNGKLQNRQAIENILAFDSMYPTVPKIKHAVRIRTPREGTGKFQDLPGLGLRFHARTRI